MSSEVTIIVSPRERFSYARDSLQQLFAYSDCEFELIYVDARSPPSLRQWLKDQAKTRGFTLLQTDYYLAPNQARNRALPYVKTPYVVFIDNDVAVSPNWLSPLLNLAKRTDAAVVGPVYCIDEPLHQKVHMAGGIAHFEEVAGKRLFVEQHRYTWKWLSDIRSELVAEPCEHQEYHCMLVSMQWLQRVLPLDERYLGVTEAHVDLCLQLRKLGGEIWLEPASVVTYVRATKFKRTDIPYYLLRWNDGWATRGLQHFKEKWGLEKDDPYVKRRRAWLAYQRLRCVPYVWRMLSVLGERGSYTVAPYASRLLDLCGVPGMKYYLENPGMLLVDEC